MAIKSTCTKTATETEIRVEALRQKLGYPIKQRDPQGSDFWYLHPGVSEADAEETAPIAIGFFSELNGLTDEQEIQRLLSVATRNHKSSNPQSSRF
ncbi:hypothetical protein C7B65_26595 [Phormidesmis priestleyi ULC007]|uniref:Uncharacterized protein n=1 Tax=Phormidesmis priestleyi ULC007 TaxID=1920490 RepID=A0A2T1D1M1_9CYAN|nr:hypothetical protein [Phormidesmis priestleyi]PSB14331.1 hypothetical protein C7B65_26595 [Phormidesmis priestleyi ULC007]